MIYRQLLAFLLSFVLIFSSTSALAAASGGWTASRADAIMNGATATITAFRGRGASAMKAVITYKPTAIAVGKEVVKGGGVLALAYAASKLLGAGVDWVLDPANNAVKYVAPAVPAGKAVYGCYGRPCTVQKQVMSIPYVDSNSVNELCFKLGASLGIDKAKRFDGIQCAGGASGSSAAGSYLVADSPAIPEQEKFIPISTIAGAVLDNAEAGHAGSQDFVKAVAVGVANSGELDVALDAAAQTTTDTPKDDPVETTKPFDDSGILDALKKILSALGLLSLLGTISDSLTAMLEWFKGEPEGKPEDNKIDIPEPPLPDIDSTISFGGSCPADLGADFNLYGTNFNFVLMPFSKLCPLLSTFVKPTLILLGSFMAVAIVGGRKDA